MKRLILIALALATTVGCSESLEGVDDGAEYSVAQFSASEIGTRVSAANQWEANDRVGIFSDSFTTNYSNVEYKATTTSDADKTAFAAVTESEQILFPNVESGSATFYAYYPYTTSYSNGLVTVDISGQKGDVGSVDFITAASETIGYGYGLNTSSVVLGFGHRLSKVVMNISCNDNISSLSGLAATLNNIATTASYSITTGAQSSGSLGGAKSVELTVDDSGVTTATVTAILHPATYDSATTLLLELNGKSYSVAFATTLSAGAQNNFTIELGYDHLITLSNNSITLWLTTDSVEIYPEDGSYDIVYNGSAYEIYSSVGLSAFAYLVNGTDNSAGAKYYDAGSGNFNFGTEHLDANARLMNDIDLKDVCGASINDNEVNWSPIGESTHIYGGRFDGYGFKVQNLYINTNSSQEGLFGYTSNTAIIKNVGVYGEVTSHNNNSSWEVGGVVGYNKGYVVNCYNMATIDGDNNVGGVVGLNEGYVINCYNGGVVKGVANNSGGIVGKNDHTVSIGYNTGTVTGVDTRYGAIIGYSTTANITGCYYLNSSSSTAIGSISSTTYTSSDLSADYMMGSDFVSTLNSAVSTYNSSNSGNTTTNACSWIEVESSYPTLSFSLQ